MALDNFLIPITLGVGALFLKPSSLYLASRTAGRVCGNIVLGLRRFRTNVMDKMATDSFSSSNLAKTGSSMMQSLQEIENITRKVSREVAETSPMARMRAATTFRPKQKSASTAESHGSTSSISSNPYSDMITTNSSNPGLASLTSASKELTGAAIICRVIEEGAFSLQEDRILGKNFTARATLQNNHASKPGSSEL